MASKKSSDTVHIPEVNEEAQEQILRRAQRGRSTATGQAIREANSDGEEDNSEDDIPEIAGDPQPDFASHSPSAPSEAQAAPAQYAVNGTVDPVMVPSNSGLVPLSSVAASAGAANKLLEERQEALEESLRALKEPDDLSDEQIEQASGAELRAIAQDRGYDLGPIGGNRSTRKKFEQAQRQAGESSAPKGRPAKKPVSDPASS